MLLVVAVLSFTSISEIFADGIFVEFDKSEYNTGDTLILSGSIPEFSMPIVAVSIYDPNGKILSANNLELDIDGTFSKIIPLNSPFYDIPGNYKVKINYKKISQEEFFTISGNIPQPDSILKEKTKPEIILLVTDKEVYTDGDNVKITGIVSSLESPTVLIGIYDPFGTPAGFYFGTIDKNLEFSTSFLVKAGVNFKVDGVYSVKSHYAETETITNFEYYEEIFNSSDDNSNSSDDNSNSSDDNSNSSDDNSNSSDDNSNSSDDNNMKNNSSNDNSIIQNNDKKQETNTKSNNNPIVKSTESKEEKKSNTKSAETKSHTKPNNLSVEDIELGKLLNQINLECDRGKYSDTISYYDGMGPALYRLCNFENSLQFFSESLSKDPNNIEVLTNKGSALGKLGYYDEAILHYEKATEINSNFLPALNNKANLLANMGKYDEAISLYTKVLGKNPNYITARQNLELVLSEMPQKNDVIIQKQIPQLKEKSSVISESVNNYEQIKLQKEKPRDFFEQIDSVFSSIASLFGISN
jgi:tetratricopeptide (TPR) repeat protein